MIHVYYNTSSENELMKPEIDDVFKEFNCFSSNQFQSIINNGTRYGKDIVLVLV